MTLWEWQNVYYVGIVITAILIMIIALLVVIQRFQRAKKNDDRVELQKEKEHIIYGIVGIIIMIICIILPFS